MTDRRTFLYEDFEISYEDTKKGGPCPIRITTPTMKSIFYSPESVWLPSAISPTG